MRKEIRKNYNSYEIDSKVLGNYFVSLLPNFESQD